MKTKVVFKSNDFLTCDVTILSRILKLNWLSCSEIELFETCMAWIKAASKQEIVTKEMVHTQLGAAFYDIRFGLMTFAEFASLIPSYGTLFSTDEYQDIIQIIADKEFKSKLFNGIRENRSQTNLWDDENVIRFSRLTPIPGGTKRLHIPETTTFTSSEQLLLKGFRCVKFCAYLIKGAIFHSETEIPIANKIIEAHAPSAEVVLYNGQTVLKREDFADVSLATPILIRPDTKYVFRFTLIDRSISFICSDVLLSPEFRMDPNIIIHFQTTPYQDAKRGLISELYFFRF